MRAKLKSWALLSGSLGVLVALAACHKNHPLVASPAAALTPAAAPLVLRSDGSAYHCAFDPRSGTLYLNDSNSFDFYSADPSIVRRPQKGRIYFTDARQRPGAVYELAGNTAKPIFNFASAAVRVVFTHTTYVRDVAFDPSGNLYFSEAFGAGKDGKIYKFDPAAHAASLFYTVPLASVGGSWAGDFTFSPDGHLYLSTGNRVGGSVYRVDDPAAPSPPVTVYSVPNEAVDGIALDRAGHLYYSNWNDKVEGHIYQVSLATGARKLLFSAPGRWIWGLSLPQ